MRTRPPGFTLVEVLVTLAILALLMAMLLPVAASARKRAASVACQAALRDIGHHLLMYANDNRGWLFPAQRGTNVPREERWPAFVFKPPVYNPPVLRCPEDAGIVVSEHSYLLNAHLFHKQIRFGSTDLGGMAVTDVVLMGEKVDWRNDYYMEAGEFEDRVELYAHGVKHGSNYLFLDLHVSNAAPGMRDGLTDPWDIPIPLPPPPATAPAR